MCREWAQYRAAKAVNTLMNSIEVDAATTLSTALQDCLATASRRGLNGPGDHGSDAGHEQVRITILVRTGTAAPQHQASRSINAIHRANSRESVGKHLHLRLVAA